MDLPRTVEERQAAADAPRSIFYRCGYSPELAQFHLAGATPPGSGLCTGANARGNFRFGDFEIFTSCDYTDANCGTRGMYSQDKAGRVTGRFGGIQWTPVGTLVSRSYRGDWETIQNPGNDARYNDFVPLVYGTVATDPSVLNSQSDGWIHQVRSPVVRRRDRGH